MAKPTGKIKDRNIVRADDPDAAFFALAGSIKPRYRPEHFKQMRKNFIKYLGTRGHTK